MDKGMRKKFCKTKKSLLYGVMMNYKNKKQRGPFINYVQLNFGRFLGGELCCVTILS